MSSLFSKQGKPQVQTTSVDPATQQYVDYMRNYARTGPGAMGGLGPAGQQSQYFADINSMNTGLGAMMDPAKAQQFMNPYLSQLNPMFDLMRQQAQQQSMQNATLGGGGGSAFDNNRAAIMQGAADTGINQLQAQTTYGAFNDAMQRALQSAGMNMGAAQYFDPQSWQARQMGILNMGIGPTGQKTTTPTQYSPLGQLAGFGSMFLGGPLGGILGGGGGGGFLSSPLTAGV